MAWPLHSVAWHVINITNLNKLLSNRAFIFAVIYMQQFTVYSNSNAILLHSRSFECTTILLFPTANHALLVNLKFVLRTNDIFFLREYKYSVQLAVSYSSLVIEISNRRLTTSLKILKTSIFSWIRLAVFSVAK